MNNFFEQLKKQGRSIRLSADEKQRMRHALYERMKQVPLAPLSASVREPHPTVSPYFFFSPRYATAFASLLIVVLGGGTAYAAEGALPGDLFYPIKIHMNEPLQVALATSPQAKAAVETHLAERRVAEAQALEAEGRLDATTTQEIEDNFNEHASQALALAPEAPQVMATIAAPVSKKTQGPRKPLSTKAEIKQTADNIEHASSTADASGVEIASSTQSEEARQSKGIHASIEIQKNILHTLKVHVLEREQEGEKREQGRGDTGNTGGTSTVSGSHKNNESTGVEGETHLPLLEVVNQSN